MKLPIQTLARSLRKNGNKWNKMSEKFISKTCKSFQRRVATKIEKKKKKMTAVLSKFSVLCLPFSFVNFFKLK